VPPARAGVSHTAPRGTRRGSWSGSTSSCPLGTAASPATRWAHIVPSQRWGIGRLKLPGWRLYFKGGWGSGSGRVDHQVAFLESGRTRIALAIFTEFDGSHHYGKRTLRGVAARLLRGLPSG
jgi:hypothetical protein